MIKEIDCPLCNGGKLKINMSNGYEVITSGALSELPCIAFCKTCNRKIKYRLQEVKENKTQK